MNLRPWTSGPKELLEHAVEHLAQGTGFDCRIAMISIDNAVELGIKTYLQLPRRVRGFEGPPRKEFDECSKSFPDLLDLLEKYAADRLDGVSLGDLEGYHRLRNALYHDGNGVTVDPVHVDGYLQVARILLKNLLDISVAGPGVPPPHSLLGQVVLKWGEFEQLVRQLGRAHLPKPKHEQGPALGVVDGLVSKGVLTGAFRSRLEKAARARNEFVHGIAVPTDAELRPLLTELDSLVSILRSMGTPQAG
ncbi:MAG: hypothetical protein HY695_03035 [Deltaproteobacteria bacterium]|nr:hypothetical protein [Deltaproteobacteria bacterium]